MDSNLGKITEVGEYVLIVKYSNWIKLDYGADWVQVNSNSVKLMHLTKNVVRFKFKEINAPDLWWILLDWNRLDFCLIQFLI